MADRIFGHVPGVKAGTQFLSRAELARATVHRPTQAGISGSGNEGADSIVLSGGYEDDEDHGDEIIYTGQGGQDPNTRKQIADQTLTRGNLALVISELHGLPLRVTRGSEHRSSYSPSKGYRYDGLYRVESHWHERGRSGFLVYRYRLIKLSDETSPVLPALATITTSPPARRETTVLRVVRDTKQAQAIKELHDYRCQVCGTRLETVAGGYAEAAHIRPLGSPHNGPDSPDNILCLCPNHHVLFDAGAFSVGDDHALIGLPGQLRKHPKHDINTVYLAYHRDHFLAGGRPRG